MPPSERIPDCKLCQDLGIPRPEKIGDPDVGYGISYPDCLANADSGQCATCRLLIDAITCRLVSKHLETKGTTLKKSIRSFSDTKLTITVTAERSYGSDAMLCVQLGPPDFEDFEDGTAFYTNPFPMLELFTKGMYATLCLVPSLPCVLDS